MRLNGKVCVITGSASGIGRSSARVFAKEGARVAAADIDEKGLKETVELIRSDGGDAIAVKTDVSDSRQVEGMVGTTVERWGRLDAVFNNAGIEKDMFIADFDESVWDRTIDVNLKGAFLGSKYAFRQFLKQKSGGAIVNTSSALGILSLPGCSAYSASKSGIIGLTKTLALDGGPHGIRVNCICPGFVLTELTKPYLGKDPESELRRIAKLHPISRVGTGEDIGYAAAFLCSDESTFVTGCVMTVDGGITVASSERALQVLPFDRSGQ